MILSFLQPLFVAQSSEIPPFRPSYTKPAGGILVENCESYYKRDKYPYVVDIFPLDSPHRWKSCNDAYLVTWQHDIFQDICHLSPELRWRLSTTMGFCPHMRCQLGDVTHSAGGGFCPSGLCFTKLEAGAPSFGACCFDEKGLFESGNLIGVENKTQAVAKPIYKHSAVFLKNSEENVDNHFIPNTVNQSGTEQCYSNESIPLIDTFFNANRMFDGSILVTQCPHTNTLNDIPLFLKQEQVHLWIQLSPAPSQILKGRYINCHLLQTILPILSRAETNSIADVKSRDIINRFEAIVGDLLDLGYSAVNLLNHSDEKYHYVFDGLEIFLLNNPSNVRDDNDSSIHPVLYIWFHHWPDFSVPPVEYHAALKVVVTHTTDYIIAGFPSNDTHYINSNGHQLIDDIDELLPSKNKAVVSCLSGRGRSGSLTSLIAAQMIQTLEQKKERDEQDISYDVTDKSRTSEDHILNSTKTGIHDGYFEWSHDLLVQLIVRLRSQRDGMVETPRQYRLVATLTGLSDPGQGDE